MLRRAYGLFMKIKLKPQRLYPVIQQNFIKLMEPVKPTEPVTTEDPKKKGPSKKELNKMKRKAKKEAKKLEAKRKREEAQKKAEKEKETTEEKFEIPQLTKRLGNAFGDLEIIQSQLVEDIKYMDVKDLTAEMAGQSVWMRIRLQKSRVKKTVIFLVLRQRLHTIQAVAVKSDTIGKNFLKFLEGVPKESVLDVKGEVVVPTNPIESCSISNIEIKIESVIVINRTIADLPFMIEDASRKLTAKETEAMDNDEEDDEANTDSNKMPIVGINKRLNNRIMDLRTPANQGIFRVQSGVCTLYREYLLSQGFTEIHTPKLLGGSSEGGCEIFKVGYFGREACLAQSPQLYKQMMVMADFERVFEIGPVFRAENSNTHRHLCEFTGLDGEMEIKQHYNEVLDVIGNLFTHIFKGLETRYANELAAVNGQYEFEPFKFLENPLKLTFEEGVQLLKENGIEQDLHDDLDTANERALGQLVREKYNTDFYILHRYPEEARPFYTMLCKDDPRFTCSYDVFMRGEEIISGAQRIHDPKLLSERATAKGLDVKTIKDYIDSFSLGAFPHGGWGVGLERVVMLYLDVGNIRRASAFPRDPKRLTP
jgi:aspartyl-tRNA synthetase